MPMDFLAWAFHSPRRLLMVVITPLVLAVVVAIVAARGGHDRHPTAVTAVEASNAPHASTAPEPTPATEVAPTAPEPAAVRAVQTFLTVWLSAPDSGPATKWHSRLARYVTPELGKALRSTDPARVPNTTPTGTPEVVRLGEFLDEFRVPLANGQTLDVTVAWDGHAWRVSDVEPEAGS
jgi:hypothetical protein